MGLTGKIKYKVLYDTFLKNVKDYSMLTNTSFIDLYTQKGHGVLEEIFEDVGYEWGNIMDTSMNIIGYPNNGLKRLDIRYANLVSSITAETTNLQIQLPKTSNINDREYIKQVLLKHSKDSWVSIRQLVTKFLIELRDTQILMTQSVDKLNLTAGLVGGYLTGSSANGLVNYNLTSGTSIQTLRNEVSGTSSNFEKFCSTMFGSVKNNYETNVTYNNEYLFFISGLADISIRNYMTSHTRYGYAENLIHYRNNNLIYDLTKAKTKYKKGINKKIVGEYRTNILKFAITLLDYDTKQYENYFSKNELPQKLKILINTQPTTDNLEVDFTENYSELSLVREFFKTTVVGTTNKSYNNKVINNITIS